MEAEGKTWNYRDILAQFITMHNKNSNVLLIWSGDWPAYSSNSDKYYVILAGEGFDSTDEAWNWCKASCDSCQKEGVCTGPCGKLFKSGF